MPRDKASFLYPSGSLPGVILRPLRLGDRFLVGWLRPRVRRRGGSYLVQTDPLQTDVGRHGGLEVAQPLQPQHSSRQARSRKLANRSALATLTEQVAWQRLSTTGMLVLAYGGPDHKHNSCMSDAAITLQSIGDTQHIHPKAGLPWGHTRPAQRSPHLHPCCHLTPSG